VPIATAATASGGTGLSGAGPVVVSGDSAAGGLALALVLSMRDAGQELPAGVDVTYTRWPRMWHDFTLQPGLLVAADSAVAASAVLRQPPSSSARSPQ